MTFPSTTQLPNELLHEILLWVIGDGIHTLCTTSDCSWELSMLATFHRVSLSFRAISQDIIGKAFQLAEPDTTGPRFLTTTRDIFAYLHSVGTQLRCEPDAVFEFAVEERCDALPASPLLISYATYLNCASMHKHAILSTRHTYKRTLPGIVSALPRALSLCNEVSPDQITGRLWMSIQEELQQAQLGLAVVDAFSDVADQIASLQILVDCVSLYGTGPIAAVYSLLHKSVTTLEAVMAQHREVVFTTDASQSAKRLLQLPGVLNTLGLMSTIEIPDKDYDLSQRLATIHETWKRACPSVGLAVKVISLAAEDR